MVLNFITFSKRRVDFDCLLSLGLADTAEHSKINIKAVVCNVAIKHTRSRQSNTFERFVIIRAFTKQSFPQILGNFLSKNTGYLCTHH